jgi:hypothetical protein
MRHMRLEAKRIARAVRRSRHATGSRAIPRGV